MEEASSICIAEYHYWKSYSAIEGMAAAANINAALFGCAASWHPDLKGKSNERKQRKTTRQGKAKGTV